MWGAVSRTDARPLVSIVVPVHDEEPVLEELFGRLVDVASREDLGVDVEMIFVDDGSTDRSRETLARLAGKDPRVRVLALSRRFGQEAACAAGLDNAAGDAVVVMDADLQDPPDVIPDLVSSWRGGHAVVHARRSSRRGDSAVKRVLAWGFYRILGAGAEAPFVTDAGNFRLIDRSVLDAISGARDRGRFLRGLACWAGGKQAIVAFERAPRRAGRSKYGLGRQIDLALDGLASFSALPVRAVGCTGALLSIAGIGSIAAGAAIAIAGGEHAGSWALAGGVAAATGLVLAGLWIVGEYAYRAGREASGLPLYVVSERIGFGGIDREARVT